eukprot:5909646-Pyramimonas_sp.AAC.2
MSALRAFSAMSASSAWEVNQVGTPPPCAAIARPRMGAIGSSRRRQSKKRLVADEPHRVDLFGWPNA